MLAAQPAIMCGSTVPCSIMPACVRQACHRFFVTLCSSLGLCKCRMWRSGPGCLLLLFQTSAGCMLWRHGPDAGSGAARCRAAVAVHRDARRRPVVPAARLAAVRAGALPAPHSQGLLQCWGKVCACCGPVASACRRPPAPPCQTGQHRMRALLGHCGCWGGGVEATPVRCQLLELFFVWGRSAAPRGEAARGLTRPGCCVHRCTRCARARCWG
jgi:hypothetical protein